MEDCDDTKQATPNELLESFGIEVPEVPEKHVPSRFDPDKHNPLWGEEVYCQHDFHYLTQLNPCPIPVNGKLAATVRFSVDDDGEADWLKTEQYRKETAEQYRLSGYQYKPEPRPKTESVCVSGDDFEPDAYRWEDNTHISCLVLRQYIKEGGGIGVGEHRSGTKVKTIHLVGDVYQRTSLCGNGQGNFQSLQGWIKAAYSNQPDDVGTYKVCSHCRRIAEARFKRKVTKRKPEPKGPKPPTPEEIARREQQRKEIAEREEKWRKEREIEDRKYAGKHLDIIEKHYPKVDEATREAAIADLMQLWNTEIYGGE